MPLNVLNCANGRLSRKLELRGWKCTLSYLMMLVV
jgi:hypothetical protein